MSPTPPAEPDAAEAAPLTDNVPARADKTRAAAAVALGLLAIDCALFILLATARFEVMGFLFAHFLLCAGAAWAALGIASRVRPDPDRTAWLQLVAWQAFLGPFGGLVGATLLLPRARAATAPAGADEAYRAPSRVQALHTAVVDDRLRITGAHCSRPLLDVMIEGTQAEKLDALSLIAKRFVPAMVPALRRALEDSDSSVRVLAATVMAQLHNGHTRRIGTLQDAAHADAARSEAWHALAQARLAYAESGLLEPERADTEVREAGADVGRAEEGRLSPEKVARFSDAALLGAACHA